MISLSLVWPYLAIFFIQQYQRTQSSFVLWCLTGLELEKCGCSFPVPEHSETTNADILCSLTVPADFIVNPGVDQALITSATNEVLKASKYLIT